MVSFLPAFLSCLRKQDGEGQQRTAPTSGRGIILEENPLAEVSGGREESYEIQPDTRIQGRVRRTWTPAEAGTAPCNSPKDHTSCVFAVLKMGTYVNFVSSRESVPPSLELLAVFLWYFPPPIPMFLCSQCSPIFTPLSGDRLCLSWLTDIRHSSAAFHSPLVSDVPIDLPRHNSNCCLSMHAPRIGVHCIHLFMANLEFAKFLSTVKNLTSNLG